MIGDLATNYPKLQGAKRLEFWVTGRISERAKKSLAALGVGVTENVDQKLGMLD